VFTMAYSLVVHASARTMADLVKDDAEDGGYAEVFSDIPRDLECVQFSAGNPRVEHITGLVHLFRRTASMVPPQDPQSPSSSKAAAVSRGVPARARRGGL